MNPKKEIKNLSIFLILDYPVFPTGESNYRGVGVAKEPFFPARTERGKKRENCPEIDFSVGKKPVVEVF